MRAVRERADRRRALDLAAQLAARDRAPRSRGGRACRSWPTSATPGWPTRTAATSGAACAPSARVEARIARAALRRVAAISAVTPAIAEEARALAPAGTPVRVVANGCDFEEFDGLAYARGERMRIVHAGLVLRPAHAAAVPGRASRRCCARAPSCAGACRRRSWASCGPADREWALGLGLGDALALAGFRPHAEALAAMRAADALLLLVPRAGGRGLSVVSGKVFEYLAAERPIVALVPPEGDAAALLRDTGSAWIADPDDEAAIAAAIGEAVAAWEDDRLDERRLTPEWRERLDRRTRARELAELLREGSPPRRSAEPNRRRRACIGLSAGLDVRVPRVPEPTETQHRGSPSLSRAHASAAILSDRIRRIVIEQSKRANVGHIGSSLSVADILGTLYAGVLRGGGPGDPERDRFVLSKGHASLALYAALHETGVIDGATSSRASASTAAASARTPITCCPASTSRPARSATGSRSRRAPRSPRASRASRAAHLRAHERRRVQRGLGLGGRHVRRPPPARQPRGHRRRQRPAGARLHARRASTSRRSTSAGAPSAGTCTRSTATTATALRRVDRRPLARPRAGRTSCWRRPSSARASRTWSARSSGTTCRWTTQQYARALAELGRRRGAAGGRGVRKAFFHALADLADSDPRVVLLTGDLGFMAVEPFAERHPGRFVNAGVAEQNMVGMATGLAEAGYVPVRLLDRDVRGPALVRVHPQRARCCTTCPVRIVGVGPGLDYGPNGITHWALEDVAVLRPLPGLAVIAPADDPQTASAVRCDGRLAGPGLPAPRAHGPCDRRASTGASRLGRAHVLGDGADVALVALGNMASTAVEAQALLAGERRRARASSSSRACGPRRRTTSSQALAGVPLALSVESHYVDGGVGSLTAEVVAENGLAHAPGARGRAPLAGRRDGQRRLPARAARPLGRSARAHGARPPRAQAPAAAALSMRPGDRIRSLQGPILVLGASGFVGANLARTLLEHRSDVVATTSRTPAWRLEDLPAAQRARVRRARGAQRRPHARRGAAAHRLQLHRLRRVLVRDRRRADPAHQPHEHARAARAPLATRNIAAYIHAGSSSEYGENAAGPEEHDFLAVNSEYAVSKAACAHLIHYYGKQHGLPSANLRLYSVYGPLEDPSRLMPQIVQHGVRGELPPLVDPHISRDFVYSRRRRRGVRGGRERAARGRLRRVLQRRHGPADDDRRARRGRPRALRHRAAGDASRCRRAAGTSATGTPTARAPARCSAGRRARRSRTGSSA